jgi:MoxR-like ATPase
MNSKRCHNLTAASSGVLNPTANKTKGVVKKRIALLLQELNRGLFDKENIMGQVLLSSVAGDGIFLLGPPGVAKSLVARKLKFAYKSAVVFEYLMNRFSTSDEIFGPVSISKLKEEDKYERNITGYLPGANIVFLDEIWKAGPAIQNALLTVLNERIFRNGDRDIRVPLKALISASNGLPAKGEGLEALWDRFLVRLPVGGIHDDTKFISMITDTVDLLKDDVPTQHKISEKEYKKWNVLIDGVAVGKKIGKIILYIKNELIPEHNRDEENEKKQLYISDRRWKKIIRLLRASAFLNGRNKIDITDCFLIKNCIWNDADEIPLAASFVEKAVSKHLLDEVFDFDELQEELAAFQRRIMDETHTISDTRHEDAKTVNEEFYAINREGGPLYIKKTDYENLNTVPALHNLYKQTKLKSGYLSHNQADLLKQKMESFTVSFDKKNIELESSFIFDRSASVSRGSAAFSVNIEGSEYKLDTKIEGERRRNTGRAEKSKERLWDTAIKNYLDYINTIRNQCEEFIKNESKHKHTNLFIEPGSMDFIVDYLNAVLKECEEAEVQTQEIQYNYKKLTDSSVPLQ